MDALTYVAVRGLWSGAGLCTIVLGAATDTDIWVRFVVVLCGLLSLLLSLLLGGFVKHITAHEEYSRGLYRELDARAERLFEGLRGFVTEAKCADREAAVTATADAKLSVLEQRVGRCEQELDIGPPASGDQ